MLRIGELAKQFQINTDTLRFYDKQGLLSPSGQSDSGYRLYSDRDIKTLGFILRAKGVGFSLTDIKTLLSIEVDKANNECSDVKELVDDKLQQVTEKIAELQAFQRSLARLSSACCGGHESAEDCTILQALESEDFAIIPECHHEGECL
ncbi:Zn(2+)-responsive transcriptional regulator [Maribrevibacterium harenarium]|uniref:Zn(2+)-responsive transcriptional regulator n=1 Tax=Maribrevibacterium harenarium TaxID=2589817 RepID=A0A501WYK0_9GAMM|nr:Zn(2+)-responsive transcriptional regulator [Maribrevibacterium harenarium]TPE53334.1 Zn(2+)-responsive transcriptional regulator [Maribrevibacterium harenarium]